MNRRDFVGLLLGAAVAPVVLPLSACGEFAVQCGEREDIKKAAVLDTTLTGAGVLADAEFLALHYPPCKPHFLLAS